MPAGSLGEQGTETALEYERGGDLVLTDRIRLVHLLVHKYACVMKLRKTYPRFYSGGWCRRDADRISMLSIHLVHPMNQE